MLKKNLRNRLILAGMKLSGIAVLFILAAMPWLPKELAGQTIIGLGLAAGFALFALQEEAVTE